jgi:hypothetical protein
LTTSHASAEATVADETADGERANVEEEDADSSPSAAAGKTAEDGGDGAWLLVGDGVDGGGAMEEGGAAWPHPFASRRASRRLR